MERNYIEMEALCACIINTCPQIMPPKHVLPIHTDSITRPMHIVHAGHVSATFGVSIYCVCAGVTSPHRAVSTLMGNHRSIDVSS